MTPLHTYILISVVIYLILVRKDLLPRNWPSPKGTHQIALYIAFIWPVSITLYFLVYLVILVRIVRSQARSLRNADRSRF